MNDVSYEGHERDFPLSSLESLADMPNYYSWIMETFEPYIKGEVMEIGAGTGHVSERIAPFAEKLTLIEPASNLVGVLRARFAGNSKVEVVCDTLETHVAGLAENAIATVVMVNVLEHIEDDRAALSRLFQILKPGGHLLLFVPALQALMSKFDLMHGHFRRYHKEDLTTKVSAAGGNVIVCRYFDLAGVAPWFFLYKILGRTTFNPTLVRINDKVSVPISRLIERLVPPPFGKNLILVASKH
jgi:SAM-dependent methyltransferase